MKDSKIAKYFLIALLLLFLYLAALVVMPVLNNIIIALVLAFAFYPVYSVIQRKLKYKSLSAFVIMILLLLLIVIPGGFILNSLIKQASSTYSAIEGADFEIIESYLPNFLSEKIDIDLFFDNIVLTIRNFIVNNAPDLIGSLAEIALGLFVMFFVMFYAFRDGKDWIKMLKEKLPMKRKYTQNLLSNTESITKAVLYGYILTAVIQGTLGGLIFFILGIPNPVFWAFIMTILAIIPFLGTPIIFVPAAIFELMAGRYVSGIILLVFGFLILINIDNFLRPKLISSKAKVHPAMVLVGVIGGLAVFGFTGIILGPMILTLLFVIVKFFALEFEN